MTKTTKKTTKPKAVTSAAVASQASFVLDEGAQVISDALGFISDEDVRARVKKYHDCATAAAASAMRQREKKNG